ncbi:unnamed protein product [Microthlaspi erraticum]|uniref:Uncharacterized protein n=1 Tax=Microthlaspi erraticum TaxID=1685480 RepID=A0A6D2KSV3_9BRAS|nr:unnamed protein product [Microthlaspi erraticum]
MNDPNDDVFSFLTTPNESDFSSPTTAEVHAFQPVFLLLNIFLRDESHPSGPSVDGRNKRIDYMIQFLDRRLSEDGNFDGIGVENGDGSDSLPEFVGKCGGTAPIFKGRKLCKR